jgi:hypothetical protein
MKTFTGVVVGEPGRAFEFNTLTELAAPFGGDYCRPLQRQEPDAGMLLLGVYRADGTLLTRVLVPSDAMPDPHRDPDRLATLLGELADELDDIAEAAQAHLSAEGYDPHTIAEWTVRRVRDVAQRAQHQASDTASDGTTAGMP